MKKIKDKGQVTLFVIIGVVLLITVLIALNLFLKGSKENDLSIVLDEEFLKRSTLKEAIDYAFFICIDNVVSREKEDFQKRGYFGPPPPNLVLHKGELIVSTYDRSYPDVIGFSSASYYAPYLEDVIETKSVDCIINTNPQLVKIYSDYVLYLDYFNVNVVNDMISVDFGYSIQQNDNFMENRGFKSYALEMDEFIDDANKITMKFLELLENPDPLFNYQVCASLKDNQGFSPSYPVDIIKHSASFGNPEIELAKDYMVFVLNKRNQNFKFVIRPYIYPKICE